MTSIKVYTLPQESEISFYGFPYLQLKISYYAQEILNVTTLYPFLNAEKVLDTNFTLPVFHFRLSRLDEAILQNEINK